jgi:hypothetical protein
VELAGHTYCILHEQASSCNNGREGLAENHNSTSRERLIASPAGDCGRKVRGYERMVWSNERMCDPNE